MADIQLSAHSLRSHGMKVARVHMHDWFILLLLVGIEILLNVIDPFNRFVGKDMMADLKYPLKNNTVPVWAVPVCILVPLTRRRVIALSAQSNWSHVSLILSDYCSFIAFFNFYCNLLEKEGGV